MQSQFENKITNTVFVTGANGYTGRVVAQGFRKRGYLVYGLVRSEEKAKEANLWEDEIIPVVGDVLKPETYKNYI